MDVDARYLLNTARKEWETQSQMVKAVAGGPVGRLLSILDMLIDRIEALENGETRNRKN